MHPRKLLCPKSGYDQHTTPNFQHTAYFTNTSKDEKQRKSRANNKIYSQSINYISKNADLKNPKNVKQFISNLKNKSGKDVSNGYKKNLCLAYDQYCQYYKISWNIPTYIPQHKYIKIPTTEQLQMLIAYAGQTLSIKLSISKETGLRPVEVMNLKVKDIDLERKTVYPTTAKHGAPRILKISNKLANILQTHIIRKDLNPNDKLFKGTSAKYGKSFRQSRNKLAKKLNNPTLKTIRLYDLRHFFATMLYHKTKDILYVKQQMGHKKIETTLIYTQLLQFDQDNNYTCKVARTQQEMTELIESGFTFVHEKDGLAYFKKRK